MGRDLPGHNDLDDLISVVLDKVLALLGDGAARDVRADHLHAVLDHVQRPIGEDLVLQDGHGELAHHADGGVLDSKADGLEKKRERLMSIGAQVIKSLLCKQSITGSNPASATLDTRYMRRKNDLSFLIHKKIT